MMIEVFAPAKINLTLHVTGQRHDGYHFLDSLVVFAPFGDVLTLEPSTDLTLDVAGPERRGVPTDSRNLVLRAARILSESQGARIHLEKNMPVASGLGGGSADAAAIVRGLRALWALEPLDKTRPEDKQPLLQKLVDLGADIPMCLGSQACRVGGVGEKLDALGPLPPIPAVVANPRVAVSTPNIFRALKQKSNPLMPRVIPQFRTVTELARWLSEQRNDLQSVAVAQEPTIAKVLQVIRKCEGALLSRMSGSGASCFGLFSDQGLAQAAAARIRKEQPDWWIATGLLGSQSSRVTPRFS